MKRQVKVTATVQSSVKAAAIQHVSCVEQSMQTKATATESAATATETAIVAILEATGAMPRKSWLAIATDTYKALDSWPVDKKNNKVGEKAAGAAGAAYVALRSMVWDKYTDKMEKKSDDQLKADRAKKRANGKANKAAAKAVADVAARQRYTNEAYAMIDAAKAFELFCGCFDSLAQAKRGFTDAMKQAEKAAADKAAADKANIDANKAAADKAAADKAAADKAAADKAARKAADRKAKLAKHVTRRAAKVAAAEMQAADTSDAIAADLARVETSNAAAAAATLS